MCKGVALVNSKSKSQIGGFFDVDPHERLKVLFLSLAFFLIIAGYTLVKDLKDSIFISVVGRTYIPYAKVLGMLVLIPSIFIYSTLVDRMNRYRLLMLYSTIFGAMGVLSAIFVGHPTIGLANPASSPYRIFGWLFYFFAEGYTPFVISVFWAFANSINSPESAKKGYALVVAASKVGGAVTAGLAWFVFSWIDRNGNDLISDITLHQVALFVSGVTLLLIPVIVLFLLRLVPANYLHGYEAAYKLEHSKKGQVAEEDAEAKGVGALAGLWMLLRYPYAMGIFGMVFFYEVIATILSYLRLEVAVANTSSIAGLTGFLFKTYFITHIMGIVISLFGTRALLNRLGERICLLLVPLLSGLLLFYFMFDMTQSGLVFAFAVLKSINYAFAWPVRESLYIPTVKDIKFKSKSWIDAFGSKLAKATASAFNLFANNMGTSMFLSTHAFFFAGVIGVWFVTAFALGRRFDRAVKNNEVIGANNQ